MKVNPYLNFPGHTREAFDFYRSVFGGDFTAVLRFRDMGDNPMKVPDDELDRIAHIALPLGNGSMLMGTDVLRGWRPVQMGNNFYITVETESAAEAQRIFAQLREGGAAEMEMQKTPWAEQYGTCADRYGVQWMVTYG